MLCKNCKYWINSEDCEYTTLMLPNKANDFFNRCTEEEAASLFGCRVRMCNNPKLLFYERPEKTGAAVVDGSEYKGALLTGEEFGCVGYKRLLKKEK